MDVSFERRRLAFFLASGFFLIICWDQGVAQLVEDVFTNYGFKNQSYAWNFSIRVTFRCNPNLKIGVSVHRCHPE